MPHHNTVFRQLANRLPWTVLDRSIAQHRADKGVRKFGTGDLLSTLLFAQISGASSLRDIEATLASQDARRYHSGLPTVCRSTLADATARRPAAVFLDVLAALIPQVTGKLRRGIGQCVRLIDSTTLPLSALSSSWARASATLCGVKAHIVYDPDADCPLYLGFTPARVHDIAAAREMPIDAGATYVFDLGYYDYGWWANLDAAGCRIVTRLKTNTPLTLIRTLELPAGATNIVSDRIGRLPQRQAKNRHNPMSAAMREIKVKIDTGKVLRIITNDLDAPAGEIADLYKRRWAVELFFRWVKQTLKLRHFYGTNENAVRIQVAIALIAFVLIKLAHGTQSGVESLTMFGRLVRATVLHRKPIQQLGRTAIPNEAAPRHNTAQRCLFEP